MLVSVLGEQQGERAFAVSADIYLPRVAFWGLLNPKSNMDEGEFTSASFNSFPDTHKWDGYPSDYGPNFVGHTLRVGTFIIDHPDFGWQAFGGDIESISPTIIVNPKETLRRRVFIAPSGTMFTLDAGVFSLVSNLTPQVKSYTHHYRGSGRHDAASEPHGRLDPNRSDPGHAFDET